MEKIHARNDVRYEYLKRGNFGAELSKGRDSGVPKVELPWGPNTSQGSQITGRCVHLLNGIR